MYAQTVSNEVSTPCILWEPAEVRHRRRSTRWQCRLPETVIGEYLAVPLISMKMVLREAERMNSWCRQYVLQCIAGNYQLFSIRRRSGERLATLGLERQHGAWSFDKCHGPGNSNVLDEVLAYIDEEGRFQEEWLPTEVYFVAHELVRLMNNSDQQG